MQKINNCSAWLYPLILIAGALQAWGPPMNGALRKSLENPWLASTVSFLPVVAFLAVVLWFCLPNPMPSLKDIMSHAVVDAARRPDRGVRSHHGPAVRRARSALARSRA